MSFFISDAFAQTSTAAAGQHSSSMASIFTLGGFLVLFFFLLWWPQNKRMKAHRQLVENLAKGDEIITNAGILGKIVKISEDFIVLQIASNVEISIQKAAVTSTVPKGTFKA